MVAALLAGLASCKNEQQFVLEGELKQASGVRMVVLYEGDAAVDSSFLTEDGRFRFTGAAPEPAFYTLVAGENTYFLVLKNGEHVTLEANMADQDGAYEVSGSEVSDKVREFSLINSRHTNISRQIQEEFRSRSMSAGPAEQDRLREEYLPRYQQNMDDFSAAVLAFVNDNQDNLAGFYAMSALDPVIYEKELITYAEAIRGKFNNNKHVQEFVNSAAALRSVSIGEKAPDFESETPDGKRVKLSDFRGTHVLLDFWASWCGPCRQENPNIVRQYKAYKDKRFEVLGVSLDRSRPEWLKGIEDDGLTWTQVSDLKFWESDAAQLYQVRAIPASFLIDPEGVIVAKNLRGEALGDFLRKTLP